jgi:protein TonB
MTDRRQCIKCGRGIDAYARICPYCNWDQTEPIPAAGPAQESAMPAYVPPADHRVRNRILAAGGLVILLIASFGIGSLVHGRNDPATTAEKDAAVTATPGAGRPSPRTNVTLVPVNESSGDYEQPITSAPLANPAEGVPMEYQRTDATAASSAEYLQMAQRAKAEKKKQVALVDPRSIQAPPAAEQRNPPSQTSASSPSAEPVRGAQQPKEPVNFPSSPARIIVSTRPEPTYQPLPDVRVRQPSTARLQIMVGKDGSVKEVTVLQGIPGETGKLIGALHRWRFKPATENGQPVEAPFTVDVLFNPHE